MSAASCSFLSFAFITSKIIGCVLLQVGHQTRWNRFSTSMSSPVLLGLAFTAGASRFFILSTRESAPGAIGRVLPLAHDTLKAELAGDGDGLAVAFNVLSPRTGTPPRSFDPVAGLRSPSDSRAQFEGPLGQRLNPTPVPDKRKGHSGAQPVAFVGPVSVHLLPLSMNGNPVCPG
jgi:hypothetical protein